MILWWIFLASLLPVPFYLAVALPALAFVPHRSLRIGLQLLVAGSLYFLSPVASVLALVFVAWSAFLDTVDSAWRYATSAMVIGVVMVLFPGVTPPIGAFLLLLFVVAYPFVVTYMTEWRRIFPTVALVLSAGLIIAVIFRLTKEALIGSVTSAIRPLFEAFGSLFLWTEPLGREADTMTNRAMGLENIKGVKEVKQATVQAGTPDWIWIATTLLTVILVAVTLYVIRKRKVIAIEREQTVKHSKQARAHVPKRHSHHPFLKIASQLEQAFPRRHEETTLEWLTRIEFPDASSNARLIDGIEFSPSEPAYDIQTFRRQVREQIER
ncbi:hypothetical protein ITJ88_06595 [Exiguobacterium sp. TBG-PICH-001]|uniref:hypothetical protein n=1 Tax=Exiguobacterium abrahamii TaxID=2785532 RepID=UPI0018A6E1B9|nr:hypothetical protein [Exiguobacterium sp. TBG-PICH-001]MBF8152952.1 hypothetical protein [Exiguobacterium sp. TBG-PICH-001]